MMVFIITLILHMNNLLKSMYKFILIIFLTY